MSRFHYLTTGTLPPKKQLRPQCKQCGKRLEPVYNYTFPTNGTPSREWSGRFGKGEGNFCRELHAMWWADETIQRIKTGAIRVRPSPISE